MKEVEKALQDFLISDTTHIASLNGPWGSGKTFFWNKFKNENPKLLEKFDGYSYVSLFGLSSGQELRRQISVCSDTLKTGPQERAKHFVSKNAVKLNKVLEETELPWLKSTAFLNEWLESHFVEKFLICIDDFERKDPALSASALMGVVSSLKEDRNCKILLIYNAEEADAETNSLLKTHREKVLDVEISFQPNCEENARHAWGESDPPNSIRLIFEKCEFNNIRVMRHVRRVLSFFEQFMASRFDNITEKVVQSCVILTIIHLLLWKRSRCESGCLHGLLHQEF